MIRKKKKYPLSALLRRFTC